MEECGTPGVRDEPFADWPLALVAMVGGVGGAVIGTTLAADAGGVFPLTWGTLGTMLGSGVCVLVWCLLDTAPPAQTEDSITGWS